MKCLWFAVIITFVFHQDCTLFAILFIGHKTGKFCPGEGPGRYINFNQAVVSGILVNEFKVGLQDHCLCKSYSIE